MTRAEANDRVNIKRYARNLQDELDGASLYAALATAEKDPVRKDLFLQLSQSEVKHADLWREKLRLAGVDDRNYRLANAAPRATRAALRATFRDVVSGGGGSRRSE
jgi:uncharacterized protein with von Willebrand factor type A (vWA) domain